MLFEVEVFVKGNWYVWNLFGVKEILMFVKDFVGVFKKVFSEKDKVFGKVFVFKLVVEVIVFIKFCVEK